MLEQLLTLNLFGFFLVFARVGTALATMPGFSAAYVPTDMRLAIGLAIAFVMAPALIAEMPAMPASVSGIAILIGGEMLIGAFLGTIATILMGALQTAGTLIAYVASLANALIQDPIAEQQSSTVASFLLVMGVVLVFTSDLHHLMLRAVADSYSLVTPGQPFPAEDVSQIMARRVADAFALGLRLSAPFVIVGLTYYVGLGFLGRLMPQLQVFFFGLPVQIGIQIWVMAIAVTGMMMAFLQSFGEVYQGFTLP
ncbi:MAG: flagellar biosynthetic protein FliR [Rhodospirillales bacterium]|nr:flagellar biosynthetic protein FliR [Rhodospirillales bacterium]